MRKIQEGRGRGLIFDQPVSHTNRRTSQSPPPDTRYPFRFLRYFSSEFLPRISGIPQKNRDRYRDRYRYPDPEH